MHEVVVVVVGGGGLVVVWANWKWGPTTDRDSRAPKQHSKTAKIHHIPSADHIWVDCWISGVTAPNCCATLNEKNFFVAPPFFRAKKTL